MKYSVIIPVYNRPDEIDELLASLTLQTYIDFEIIVVEDGSRVSCKEVVEKYSKSLTLLYVYQENTGPGISRNRGALMARGEYLIFLDSDCVVPPHYLATINQELLDRPCGAFGGPDRSHQNFTRIQKAIGYTMTSFFTTGGIRGGTVRLDKFYPRSFNMGVRTDIYNRLEGFSNMRFGEDVDLSLRLFESGVSVRLFPEAWVFHKRRIDLSKFFKQVFNSGIARINLYKRHPQSLKLVHLLPAFFTVGCTGLFIGGFFCPWLWLLILFYCLAVAIDAWRLEQSFFIAMISVAAAFVQLFGYGFGFLTATWYRLVLKKDEFSAFGNTFYN